ncbi:MAG: hypothetical protein JO144_10625 [Actinobacteria bacterium]|nr:hypothetical protein [Actinomycetota bacterium]
MASLELDIAWGAWAELGVSGWVRSHRDWAVDPEPLIVVTPLIAEADARLRDEALDWCVSHWRHISRARLRNLLRAQPDAVIEAYRQFAGTVNEHSAANWPDAGQPQRYTPTRRSTPPRLDRNSLVWLRTRAMFGASARAEILRYFLSHRGGRVGIAALATVIGYAKRNVAEECAALHRAGVLAMRPELNRLVYALERDEQLRAFVGGLPPVLPDWTALLRITRALAALEDAAARLPARALNVEAHRVLAELGGDFDRLEVPAQPLVGNDYWAAVQYVIDDVLTPWAQGRWHR